MEGLTIRQKVGKSRREFENANGRDVHPGCPLRTRMLVRSVSDRLGNKYLDAYLTCTLGCKPLHYIGIIINGSQVSDSYTGKIRNAGRW